MGVYLFGFATAALLLAALSTLGKPYFAVLLFLASARMLLTGLYEVGATGKTVYEVAGGFALTLAVLAFYGGVALGLETRTSARSCRSSGAEPRKSRSQ